MAKKSKKRKNREKFIPKVQSGHRDRGFDFGLLIRTMAVPDFEFNQSLRDAGIIGCAYGFQTLDNLSHPVPSITLIGTNIAAFERAYQAFQRWGCEEDGDVLDVELLLKTDGSYNIWISPEMHHLLYRTIPQADLYETLAMNFSWVKTLDSTHEMVHQLKRYCESKIHPVIISAAISNSNNPSSFEFSPVVGWKNILKFGLRIIDQSEAPEDFRFAPISKRSSPKYEKIKSPTPEVICQRRINTLDIAFPVSRERVRRSSLLGDVKCLPGFEKVTETQVVQAAINLMLSEDLVPGDIHYRKVTRDVEKTIWDSIASRIELADGASKPTDQNPSLVARQIELDVQTTLKRMKAGALPKHFPQLQEVFLREGYVNV